MTQVLVGAGGWAYFQVAGNDSLTAYSHAFDFVEINRSYYRMPSLSLIRTWRMGVPDSFNFSLRCPNQLIDQYNLKLDNGGRRLVEKIEQACNILRAPVLALLITDKAPRDKELVTRMEEFFKSFHLDETKVAVEFRRRIPTEETLEVMRANGALHTVDLSKEDPEYDMPILYSRLFGKGEKNIYEFDEKELEEIGERAKKSKIEKSILAFHGVRMYRDAARMKTLLEKGYFPRITNNVGLDAIEEVLKEDVQFPATKAELVQRQGWKLFNVTRSETKRMRDVLLPLHDRSYADVGDVLRSLKEIEK